MEKYNKLDIYLTVVFLLITISLFLTYIYLRSPDAYSYLLEDQYYKFLSFVILLLILAGFVYGSVIYLITRLGYISRLFKNEIQTNPSINEYPDITILVPSYKEETKVIEQTLLSASLLDYPKKNVVLLIDNPPNPNNPHDKILLDGTYGLVNKLNSEFKYFRKKINNSQKYIKNHKEDESKLLYRYNQDVDDIIHWFELMQNDFCSDHVDEYFTDEILNGYIILLRNSKDKINGDNINRFEEASSSYNQLSGIFNANLQCFERKKYLNLSHEANKAMNLNSYIGLMGNKYIINEKNDTSIIEVTEGAEYDLDIPDTKYILTLDADSLLKMSYAKKLVSILEHNKKIAVVQTPYCSYQNTPNLLEDIAGATTDIQYNIHQGFTYFNASFWVGANAIIRKKALSDIIHTDNIRGFEIKKYVHDRTVIEDTESSIDLRLKGWSIFNHPEKLSFSATPSDFGSLVIQRRRWANGGLVIYPKLMMYFLKNIFNYKIYLEYFVRSHYLLSISIVNYGFLFLIILPFDKSYNSLILPLIALPYLIIYTMDLSRIGYKWTYIFKIYSFNILLIPVNIVGVNKSIEQLISKKKIPFMRTPKIGARTPASVDIIIFEYVLLVLLFVSVIVNSFTGNYMILIFSFFNLFSLTYGLYLIGVRSSYLDLLNQIKYFISQSRYSKLLRN